MLSRYVLMMMQMTRRFTAVSLLIVFSMGSALADDTRWEHGLSVQLPDSRFRVSDVTSPWASDPTFFNGRTQQGPIYFNDCLTLRNEGSNDVTHVQVMFAPVDLAGNIKRTPMPFDTSRRILPGATITICRDHAYANGARGWWLVGWVNVVDYADGTTWHAPTGAKLREAIVNAIPQDGNS